jgi:hypothetical protein
LSLGTVSKTIDSSNAHALFSQQQRHRIDCILILFPILSMTARTLLIYDACVRRSGAAAGHYKGLSQQP